MSIKLPKSWKHWCRKARIDTESKRSKWRRSEWSWFSLIGRNHHWRVNCHGMFQLGDDVIEFDRWALSEINEVVMPQTEAEFLCAVQSLLEARRAKKGE